MHLHLERAWIDDLKIHDVADPLLPYALRAASRSVAPRADVRDRGNRHGSVDDTRWYGGQAFNLAGYVSHDGGEAATEAAYDDLRAAVALPGEHVFRFRRRGRPEDERVVCKQQGGFDAPAEGWSRLIRWSGTLFAPDPRVYSAALKSASYDPTAALTGGGVSMPLSFPLVFSTSTVTLLHVTNAGRHATPPIFTVRGPGIDPIVDLLETGESVTFKANLGASDVVVVDVAARTVTLNGALRRDLVVARQSRWFELVKGTNRLRLRGTGMVANQTSLQVSYRDASI